LSGRCRANNRWLTDYRKPYPERLFSAATLPMRSVDHLVVEMAFAAKELGFRYGLSVPIRTMGGCMILEPGQ
jgi:predicted TIM-barrel fold metal-dependent hydrolase